MTEQTLVKLTGLYENQSKAGQTYFVGYLGASKVLVLKDKHATEGQPGWARAPSHQPLADLARPQRPVNLVSIRRLRR